MGRKIRFGVWKVKKSGMRDLSPYPKWGENVEKKKWDYYSRDYFDDGGDIRVSSLWRSLVSGGR